MSNCQSVLRNPLVDKTIESTVVKFCTNRLPTSQLPPESPLRYVVACSRPPNWPFPVELDVRLSNAESAPAPFIRARYPPPDTATPIRGSTALRFPPSMSLTILSMYSLVSRPLILKRVRRLFNAGMVLLSRRLSHVVSLAERPVAARIVGRGDGHDTEAGA